MIALKGIMTLLFVGIVVWKLLKTLRGERTWKELEFRLRPILGAVVMISAWLILLPAVGYVPAGYRGVILRFGAVTSRILDEGIYVVTPVAETVQLMSVQTMAFKAEASAASQDLQVVSTTVTLNYALEPERVSTIFQTLRLEYESRIIDPAIQEAVKSSTARFKAEELITKREVVREEIQRRLMERLGEHGMTVDKVNITNFDFSAQFNTAIEAKVTAEQQALKALRDLERVKLEAQQKIEQAKAEAEALRLQRQNISSELVELRRIEAQMKAIEKWNGQMPTTVIGDGGAVPMIQVFR